MQVSEHKINELMSLKLVELIASANQNVISALCSHATQKFVYDVGFIFVSRV